MEKKQSKGTEMEVRKWNGTRISRRTTDGYVNATAMCDANGQRWNNYWRNDRTKKYVKALSAETRIRAHLLVQAMLTGPNAERGTWVHPRLAVDLARWISAEFAVWMDGWFLEEVKQRSRRAAAPQPLDPKGAQTIVARIESNKDLGEMSKDHGIPYAATHQIRNTNFWNESTQSLKERAGSKNWHGRSTVHTQLLTYYVNDLILREAEAMGRNKIKPVDVPGRGTAAGGDARAGRRNAAGGLWPC